MKTGWSVEENYFPTITTLINNLYGKCVTKKSQIILKRPIIKEEWKLKKDDIVLKKEIGQVCFVLKKNFCIELKVIQIHKTWFQYFVTSGVFLLQINFLHRLKSHLNLSRRHNLSVLLLWNLNEMKFVIVCAINSFPKILFCS